MSRAKAVSYSEESGLNRRGVKIMLKKVISRIIIWLGLLISGCLFIPVFLLVFVISTVCSCSTRLAEWMERNEK